MKNYHFPIIFAALVCFLLTGVSLTAQVVAPLNATSATNPDWQIRRSGEHLEIVEPEQSNQVWARFNDGQSLELLGTPNLIASGNISAAVNKRIRVGQTGGSYIGLHAATCCPGAYLEFDGGPLFFRHQNNFNFAPLIVQTNGSVVINGEIDYSGGNIPTNNHQLSVNGGIWCEQLEIIANVPSSDYVFETDYDLMPLEDVKAFVQENKHLPEVPSAAEFAENGYFVGDMDDLLLRKVEELTLHLIDLSEQNQVLQARLNRLENVDNQNASSSKK